MDEFHFDIKWLWLEVGLKKLDIDITIYTHRVALSVRQLLQNIKTKQNGWLDNYKIYIHISDINTMVKMQRYCEFDWIISPIPTQGVIFLRDIKANQINHQPGGDPQFFSLRLHWISLRLQWISVPRVSLHVPSIRWSCSDMTLTNASRCTSRSCSHTPSINETRDSSKQPKGCKRSMSWKTWP